MPPPQAPSLEINALISKLKSVADEIHNHTSKMTMQDFKRLLFRTASALITVPESELVQELVALPFVAFTPSSIAAGIEAWTWLIGERPDLEISLMTDISEAWAETIKLRKGLFSPSMKCALLSCLTTRGLRVVLASMIPSTTRWNIAQPTKYSLIVRLRLGRSSWDHIPNCSECCLVGFKLLDIGDRG